MKRTLQRAAVVAYIAMFFVPFLVPNVGVQFGAAVVAFGSALFLAISGRSAIWGAWAVYLAALIAAGFASGVESPHWLFGAASALALLSAFAGMALVFRAVRGERELERVMSLEATSFAFFVTMIGVLTYSILDMMADVPAITLWPVFMLGMVAWGVGAVFMRRRFS